MITQRKTELLKTLVGDYIESANPVGSESFARKHSLGVSPATVRNDLADLEEQGYITRPHHSAGAVPLDKGYRFYVETMPLVEELTPESQHTLRFQFTKAERDIEGWTRLAATLLSQLVNNVGMVTYPRESESRLMRINLVPIQESLAFLILVLQEVKLRKQLLPLSEPLNVDDLQTVANKLSDSLSGLNRQEILAKTKDASPFERTVTESVVDIMEAEDMALYSDHYIEGAATLAEPAGVLRRREGPGDSGRAGGQGAPKGSAVGGAGVGTHSGHNRRGKPGFLTAPPEHGGVQIRPSRWRPGVHNGHRSHQDGVLPYHGRRQVHLLPDDGAGIAGVRLTSALPLPALLHVRSARTKAGYLYVHSSIWSR